MTTAQLIDHVAYAHDGLLSRTLHVRGRHVSVSYRCTDGSHLEEPVGPISKPGVWPEACAAAGIATSRLTRDGDWISVEITDGEDVTESLPLCDLSQPGAWREVPHDLFDDFETLVDEWEGENSVDA